MDTQVTLLSNFGPEVRGLSLYTDSLAAELDTIVDIDLHRLDYQQAYPASLMPTSGDSADPSPPVARVLHWAKPSTWRAVAEQSSNILHIQHWNSFGAYYLHDITRRAQSLGKRVVLTVHNPSPHEALPLFGRWERRLVATADALILHNERGREILLREHRGIHPERLHIIPHGINLSANTDFDIACRTAGLSNDRRHLLTFGNLRGYKGIPGLLKAWRKIMHMLPDVDLVIAGRLWSGRGGLSALTGRLLGSHAVGMDIKSLLADPELSRRVVFREGFITASVIDALCDSAELAVFPHQRMAGQSGVVSHAAGRGVPVLVSDVGGLPELAIDRHFVVPPGDIDALADRLLELLGGNPGDYRSAQRKHVAQFAWPRVALRHAELYRMLGT